MLSSAPRHSCTVPAAGDVGTSIPSTTTYRQPPTLAASLESPSGLSRPSLAQHGPARTLGLRCTALTKAYSVRLSVPCRRFCGRILSTVSGKNWNVGNSRCSRASGQCGRFALWRACGAWCHRKPSPQSSALGTTGGAHSGASRAVGDVFLAAASAPTAWTTTFAARGCIGWATASCDSRSRRISRIGGLPSCCWLRNRSKPMQFLSGGLCL